MAKKQKAKTNRRMKRTVLGTLSAIFMASALIVAIVPSSSSQAEGGGMDLSALTYPKNTSYPDSSVIETRKDVIALQRVFEGSSKDVDQLIPSYSSGTTKTAPVYTDESGLFSVAYAQNKGSSTKTGVIVNFDINNVSVSSTLTIPETIKAFVYDASGTNLQAVCKVDTSDSDTSVNTGDYLYYVSSIVDTSISEDSIPTFEYTISPCYASNIEEWNGADADGNPIQLYKKKSASNPNVVGSIVATDGNTYIPAEQLSINIQYIGSQKYNPETGDYYPYNSNGTQGVGVFQDATQISTLKIGSNILAIGNNAFINCQFASVSLGNKVQQIGDYAFYNCNRLSNLALYDENDKDPSARHATTALNRIGACAFANCISLSSLIMPDQVQYVGFYCFANDTGLNAANLNGLEDDGNSSLTKIGNGAFMNCTNLGILRLANGLSNIDTVEYLTYDCESLKELCLPNNPGNNGYFRANNITGCAALQILKVPNNSTKLECGNKYSDHINAVGDTYVPTQSNMGDGYVDAVGKANLGCHTAYPDEYTVPSSFVLMGNRSNESKAYVYAKEHGYAFGYKEGGVEYYEKLSENYFYTIVKPEDGSTVASLSKFAIDDTSKSCEYVIIPKSIGPYTIGSISSSVFAGLEYTYKEQISYVEIPSSITDIGPETFEGVKSLETVKFDNAMNINAIGSNAFRTNATSPSVKLRFIGAVSDGGVESIPFLYAMTTGNTFNDPDVLDAEYITYCTPFPQNLQIRLAYTIDPVTNIVTDTTPTLVAVPKGAKYYSQKGSLANITDFSLDPYLADKQNAMATQALSKYATGSEKFSELTQTQQDIVTATTVLNVPFGVTGIAESGDDKKPVISGNKDLKTVIFNSILDVQDGLFNDCENLANFTMNSSGAAEGEKIGSFVFENCPSLASVNIAPSVNSLGNTPFHGAINLYGSGVNFGGSPYFAVENDIIYGLDSDGLKDNIIECLRVRGTTSGTSFISSSDFEGVSQINPYAFYDCDGVLTVDLSTSEISKIPENCFDSCENLFQCSLPNATTEIESKAFKDTKIRKILIPNTFAHISDEAFVDSVDKTLSGNDVPVRDVDNLIIQGYSPSTAENYANSALHPTFVFEAISAIYDINFVDGFDGSILHSEQVAAGDTVAQVTWAPPSHDGLLFAGWDPENYYTTPVSGPMTITAKYEASANATYTVTFKDDEGNIIYKQTVVRDGYASAPPVTPSKEGYSFIGWDPSNYDKVPVTKNFDVTAQFIYTGVYSSDAPSASPTPSDLSGQSTNKDTTTETSKGNTSSTSGTNSSSGNKNNGTNANTSGSNAGGTNANATASPAAGSNSGNKTPSRGGSVSGNGTSASGTTNKQPIGTKVDVTKTGISNSGLVNATVNGANGDNFVVKITDSEAAKSAVQQALLGEYGSLDAIKYFAMDISLYDATGTTKLENLSGVSVTITMPIPDALTPYGGNNKAGAVLGSTLEKLDARFTTINNVPCISFTATHFSPYTIYVDTNNLTATGTADITPKTADPIEPKWFLVLGLAFMSILMFVLRGPKAKVVKVIS